ncbi:uncharacterized protein LOC111371977 [Olea europaea var. sylvestris]|uniref:uncharacterized protein LOC111371977 n=1 Tax=Olea europaea var. sylvestris TaxID=158386 RepID=UPI000C1CD392|nr:uncharacterized protein LOC111371977 [Olea europaea var. sylvestris]
MEVYVDDMLVKSIKAKDHCQHLTEMFDILKKYGMKLNPRKCAFGVCSGRFLCYIVNNREIEENHEKIQAIIQMKPPTKPGEVQSLTGRVAALSRPPVLSKPKAGEALKIYLSVSKHAISAVLTQEENDIQHPIYYVSKALHEAELRYSAVEKLAFTLLMAARKLRPYFLEHPIEVLTNSPLRQMLQRPDTSGRMVKWVVELEKFDIKYTPRSSIKGQTLTDCVSKFCNVPTEEQHKETPWKLYVDGSSTRERSGADVVLINPDHRMFCETLPFDFKASNNEVEYEALIAGARMASGLGISDLILHSDSQLVVNQVNGVYMAKEDRMDNCLRVVKKELERFKTTQVKQIPRSHNNHADALARLATSEEIEEFDSIPVGRMSLPSTELDKVARKLRTRSARYTLIDNILYKRGYSTPLLRCLNEEEAQYALQDIHEGICENHSGGLSLAHKIVRQGYFWPAIKEDSLEFVKRCDKCQRLAPIINTPPHELNPVTVP